MCDARKGGFVVGILSNVGQDVAAALRRPSWPSS